MTDSRAELRAALIATALAVPIVLLTVLVMADFAPLVDLDNHIVDSVYGAVSGSRWEGFFDWIAKVSQTEVVFIGLIAVAIWFAFRRHWRYAIWVLAIDVAQRIGYGGLKHIVDRDRPDIPNQIAGSSFPSGHATSIAAAMGVLIVLTHQSVQGTRLRQGLIGLWVAIAAIVGFEASRRRRALPE